MDSRIPGFYKLSLAARRRELQSRLDLEGDELAILDQGGVDLATADRMVENALGVYGLPLGLATNFRVGGRDYVVPMAVEEPSVIAAASNAAKMVRAGGGFHVHADDPVMTAQIEILDVHTPDKAVAAIQAASQDLIQAANRFMPRMVERGGGARHIDCRVHETARTGIKGSSTSGRVVVHVHIDCRDAMGANLVNTVAEGLAARIATLAGGRPGLRILTNLTDRRMVRASARVPFEALATTTVDGDQVAQEIASASAFAEQDAYRAATHNKGIMNGIDAVVLATGNDWRGVEAGAHAWAAITGRYRPLCGWVVEGDALLGRLEMPLAVGTVGGTVGVHAGARLAQKILQVQSATELAGVIAAVGMASNLAALRALATDGIQRGHMACHRRAIGLAATGEPDQSARIQP